MRRNVILTGCGMLLLLLLSAQNLQAQQPAFPGAEGFGMYTTGGRGGRVIKVTNLNDSGEGSFRAAVEASGPRIVVFEVSGTIQLKSRLVIQNDNITIAGQTAPGDGICIRDYALSVNANNVIIRYIRSRLGDESLQEDDALGGRGYRNIIIDHCTASWSTDECVSFYGNQNFTMQWCLIGESLRNSVHSKGPHGYGGIWGGEKASFHHNLLANHSSRNPRFSGSRYTNTPDQEQVDFRNNVIYNWEYNSAYGAEGGSYNMVNNYYKPGPATEEDVRSRIIHADIDNGDNAQPVGVHGIFFVEGNTVVGDEVVSKDNWNGGVQWGADLQSSDLRSDTEFDAGNVLTDDAEDAYLKVIEYVGASLSRDTVDKRTIRDLIHGTATITDGGKGSKNGIIDTQSAVGGWPVLTSLPAPDDIDGDGMPDAWELSHGLDPNDPADGNEDRTRDGYTNIEEYINSLAHGYFNTAPLINMTRPRKNEVFISGADTSIQVEAYANDYNGGMVIRMELYLDDLLIGEYGDSTRIMTTLENVSPGMHYVTVIAADDSGKITVETNTIFVGREEVSITVEDSPHGQVILDPPGGIYSDGVQVKITAVPDEGYLFHSWIKDIETAHSYLQLETVGDLTIKPVFAKDQEKKGIWFHPIKINYQPKEDYPIPLGYIRDCGEMFKEKLTGFTYGWMEGNNPFYGLNPSKSGVWNAFKRFESSGNTYSWGIELPKGMYRIRLGLGGKRLQGLPTETELMINVEGIEVKDNDGVDLLDEHLLDSIPVLDGQLTLTSVEQSRICFIEIELLELVSPRTLTVENGKGGGKYYPDLREEIMVVADTPPDGQVFDQWTGDTLYLEDVSSSTTFVTMPDTGVSISATYTSVVQDTAYYLLVVNGAGSGIYTVDTDVVLSAPDTLGGGSFSHWECGCRKPVLFDSRSSSFTFSMPDANVVFEPVYEISASGEGDIYQAEEAIRDDASIVERYYGGYYGTGYVNFQDDVGSYVQFINIDGKEGGTFTIKLRYSLNDRAREGVVTVNGIRDTIVMSQTDSWSDWSELDVRGSLEPGSNNTILIETSGDDLGYLDQIELVRLNTTRVEASSAASELNLHCYPNPFGEEAMVSFELDKASDVRIQLYNLQGKRVRELSLSACPEGIKELSLHRENLMPGFYILRVLSDHTESMLKVLIK